MLPLHSQSRLAGPTSLTNFQDFHLICVFWSRIFSVSGIWYSQWLCICAKGTSRNHDLYPRLSASSRKWSFRESCEFIPSGKCQKLSVQHPLTLEKNSRRWKIQIYKTQSKHCSSIIVECLSSQRNSTRYPFKCQLPLAHFAFYQTLIYKQSFSYTSVAWKKVHIHRCVCAVRDQVQHV